MQDFGFDRGVPLEVVETALLLACLRRRVRPTDVPPLPRVPSLAYFQPVIEELPDHPAPTVQKSTLSGGRHTRRAARLAEIYTDWRNALPAACNYLFDLNRYAKYRECGPFLRERIYGAKNQLIEVLYQHGYSTECYEHHSESPARICFCCDGTGHGDNLDNCGRCGGSGIHEPAKRLTFITFKFNVNGTTYCWHQPDIFVRFHVTKTQEPAPFGIISEEKPVSLSPTKFDEALEFLWVVGKATTRKSTELDRGDSGSISDA